MVNSEGKSIKLAVFDIDHTLCYPGENVFPYAEKALQYIREKGVPVCIATGRSPFELPGDIASAAQPEYLICINGGMIYNRKKGEVIKEHKLSRETSLKILDIVKKYRTGYCVYDGDRDLIDEESVANWQRMQEEEKGYTWIPDERVPDLTQYIAQGNGTSKICGFSNKTETFLTMREEIEKLDGICTTSASRNEVEVLPQGVDKAAGLKELCGILGISTEDVFCMGDGENDAGMLSISGISVAMKDSFPQAIKAAKYHSDSPTEMGVYDAVMRFFN